MPSRPKNPTIDYPNLYKLFRRLKITPNSNEERRIVEIIGPIHEELYATNNQEQIQKLEEIINTARKNVKEVVLGQKAFKKKKKKRKSPLPNEKEIRRSSLFDGITAFLASRKRIKIFIGVRHNNEQGKLDLSGISEYDASNKTQKEENRIKRRATFDAIYESSKKWKPAKMLE